MRSPVDIGLLRRFDHAAPRYTSYPTADRFVESFGTRAYHDAVASRNCGAVRRPLSLYAHLPFCRDLCYYCACNKIVTRNRAKTGEYLRYLDREIALQGALFRDDPRAVQMHWGGGTPTYHDVATLRGLFARIREWFDLAVDGEYSIEVDPRTVDGSAIEELGRMGFNRVSFGVQDFDPRVQAAIHRPQSEEQTIGAIGAARRSGFRSVNVDLIYGLPRQTQESFNLTLSRVIEVRPDRIALYSYAHLPAAFPAQRRIADAGLPSPAAKIELFALAASRLDAAGYGHIGMDHFALPGDDLAVAQRQGRLHRNFQGYSTLPEADLVGLGVSAIGAVGATYSKNHRDLGRYYGALDGGDLPIMRGAQLTRDDLVRRAVIQALMCQFTLSKASVEVAYLLDFDRYFEGELAALREFEQLGLVADEDGWITVTPKGRFLVRSICRVFDRYSQIEQDDRRYSRVI